jgi:heterodisulfide reductase subunit B
MKTTHVSAENTAMTVEKSSRCAECGWPGIGKMPTGVRRVRENGKNVLIGQLSYYPVSRALCSVCQEMESAVNNRPWFVEAHAEYLEQVKATKRLLGER